MLTKLTVRNFKQFEDVTVELDNVVVFVGPNDSGKTTALQALALWELGLRRWRDRWGMVPTDDMQRPGVSINRLDMLSAPVSHANLLWRGLRTREVNRREGGTSNVRIEIIVEGIAPGGKKLDLRTGVRLRQSGIVLLSTVEDESGREDQDAHTTRSVR